MRARAEARSKPERAVVGCAPLCRKDTRRLTMRTRPGRVEGELRAGVKHDNNKVSIFLNISVAMCIVGLGNVLTRCVTKENA